MYKCIITTPQPLYNSIVGVQASFCVYSYPNHVISRVKCVGYIRKGILINRHLGSNPDPCFIQNHVITNCYKEVQVYGVQMSCLMRIGTLSSCIIRSFKRACIDTQQGEKCGSLFETSNVPYIVCEQRRLWRDLVDAHAHLSLRCLLV